LKHSFGFLPLEPKKKHKKLARVAHHRGVGRGQARTRPERPSATKKTPNKGEKKKKKRMK